eukprot:scaffold6677_cov155-Skeletonema_menzelii.AAC.10
MSDENGRSWEIDGDGMERESGEERSERRRSLQVNTPYWRARIFFNSRLAPPGTKKGKGRNCPMGHTTDTTLESTNDGHVTQFDKRQQSRSLDDASGTSEFNCPLSEFCPGVPPLMQNYLGAAGPTMLKQISQIYNPFSIAPIAITQSVNEDSYQYSISVVFSVVERRLIIRKNGSPQRIQTISSQG